MPALLPAHLKRYVVEQDYSRYTPLDQEVWRYIMRQLRDFLSQHAHPCYLEGLSKTGIETDRIPDIRHVSDKLEKFGWRAMPVSGFIPPAAFMELQAHSILPIASDMRTIDHVAYTPAPDIVHEAAGHAPILIAPEFAAYLKSYAQVARRAIISHEDMNQYEAIRVLSDIKEDPHSTPDMIARCERELERVSSSISHISEAAYLGRMNWWTAEYGLIGDLANPRIFGAGLLSSIGEARGCLAPSVKKHPLSLECIHISYDITEPQPQLFVARDFGHLGEVLEELAATMAFRRGGIEGLEKAKRAATVNTVQLETGLQISGLLKDYRRTDQSGSAVCTYLQFDGPSQLALGGVELPGHGKSAHPHGFGAPLGPLAGAHADLSRLTPAELDKLHLRTGQRASLHFESGVELDGLTTSLTRDEKTGRLVLISFSDCRVRLGGDVLFDPSWGTYDMAVGQNIAAVFGGPADRIAYGETSDFVAKTIPRKDHSPEAQRRYAMYSEIRTLRESLAAGQMHLDADIVSRLARIEKLAAREFQNDWLIHLDLLEIGKKYSGPGATSWMDDAELELERIATAAATSSAVPALVRDGLRLLM